MNVDFDRLLPSRPEDADIKVVELGERRYPVLVVDGFFRDPDHLREFALSLRYREPPIVATGSWASISLPVEPLVSFLHAPFGHTYFASARAMAREGSAWHFVRHDAPPRGDTGPSAPRPRAESWLLTGIVDLTTPDACGGGLSFFRHEATGAEELLPKQAAAAPDTGGELSPALRDRLQRAGAPTPTETPDPGRWEGTRTIELKYNRLVLFPAFLLHAVDRDDRVGTTLPAWRLSLNFMFHWPVPPP